MLGDDTFFNASPTSMFRFASTPERTTDPPTVGYLSYWDVNGLTAQCEQASTKWKLEHLSRPPPLQLYVHNS